MKDINECKFLGTIERLQEVGTKSGTRMARWLLHVGQDRFRCVAFRNIAEEVLQCNDGDRLNVSGSGRINSYEVDGHWRNDFQLSVWAVEIDARVISYQKGDSICRKSTNSQEAEPKIDNVNNRTEPQYPEHGQRSVADFEGMPF